MEEFTVLKCIDFKMDIYHSAAIRQRLFMVLRNVIHEQELLSLVEGLTHCDFPEHELMLIRLIDQISCNTGAVKSVKSGYSVWKSIQPNDRLFILYNFFLLLDRQCVNFLPGQKVQLFCQYFLKHFIPVLAEYGEMNVPD